MANIYNFLDSTYGRSLRILIRSLRELRTEVEIVTAGFVRNIHLEKQIADIVPDFSGIVGSIELHFRHRCPLIVLVGCRPELVVGCFDQLIVVLIFVKGQFLSCQ